MVRMPLHVGLCEPWNEPDTGFVISDATEADTHAPSLVAHSVWVDKVLMNRYQTILVVVAPHKYLVRVIAVYKAAGSVVRFDVAVSLNEDAQRSNFLVISSLNPGVAQSKNFMHFDADVVVRHPGGLIVYNMLINYGEQPATKNFNRLRRRAPRMVAGPANGREIAMEDLNKAMFLGTGYNLVPGLSAPFIGGGRLEFWPHLYWDDGFRQLITSVASSMSSVDEPPIDLVEAGDVGSGACVGTPTAAAAGASGAGASGRGSGGPVGHKG